MLLGIIQTLPAVPFRQDAGCGVVDRGIWWATLEKLAPARPTGSTLRNSSWAVRLPDAELRPPQGRSMSTRSNDERQRQIGHGPRRAWDEMSVDQRSGTRFPGFVAP